jgi:hypothetical protein
MRELSDIQLDMLCEMSEIHLKWFNLYSPEVETTFEEVLQLNHIKVTNIIDGCSDCSDDIINFIFESIIKDYKQMLEDYSK